LHSFKWYEGLYAYSRPGQEEIIVEERELGPDGDLVASMISTSVIPMICKIIDGGALDVYSLKHIKRIIDLCEEIEASLESGNVKFQVRRFTRTSTSTHLATRFSLDQL
jgi:GC-rich sequence DNA-binding factor